MTKYIIIIIISIILITIYRIVILPADRFFKMCDEFEKDLKSTDDLERHFSIFQELDEDSYPPISGKRMDELASIINKKYGIKMPRK